MLKNISRTSSVSSENQPSTSQQPESEQRILHSQNQTELTGPRAESSTSGSRILKFEDPHAIPHQGKRIPLSQWIEEGHRPPSSSIPPIKSTHEEIKAIKKDPHAQESILIENGKIQDQLLQLIQAQEKLGIEQPRIDALKKVLDVHKQVKILQTRNKKSLNEKEKEELERAIHLRETKASAYLLTCPRNTLQVASPTADPYPILHSRSALRKILAEAEETQVTHL